MIRAILFDLDRTLLNRDESLHQFLLSQYERFSSPLATVPREIYVARITALDDRGRIWKDKVYQAFCEEFTIRGISWQDLFDDFDARIAGFYIPFRGLRQTLNQLKASGYLLGIVTNGREEFQRRTLRALGIEGDFNTVLISVTEGVRKPDAEIFLRALRNLKCRPDESIFVGDHPEVDIKGAHEVGMRTIWKRNQDFPAAPCADAVINDLDELPILIERLQQACPP
jgi:putative hydrolase of the HAD superfamily